MSNPTSPLLAYALAAHDAGLCVYPLRQDGSKRPDASSWTRRQSQRPTREELARLSGHPHRTGIGSFCGAVSGNLALHCPSVTGSASVPAGEDGGCPSG